jgi:membrane protease YdiL (CAAX protease family)
MLAEIARALLVIFLAAAVPILSRKTARPELLRQVPRTTLYLSAVFSQWILAVAALAVVFVSKGGLAAVGFRPIHWVLFGRWGVGLAGTAVAGLGLVIFLENRGWLPPEPETVHLLMPETLKEKLWALFLVAPTAAVCEEFLYRGFLLTALTAWFHSARWGVAVSSLGFGLAHTYQGASGVARAALLGALLAVPVVRYGSIYPAVLAHFLIDATALLWLGPRFLRRPSQAGKPLAP